ncbi:MAG: hypothetical protein KIS78_04865 [Labilithrix sp.]|nr:hypothetical protein [Labilithrix sp.]
MAVTRDPRRDGLVVAGVGLLARLAVVAWAAGRIPPTADGTYYDTLAARLAEGHGYTWLWPDGAVTYAAHYPVGYPAMVALGYALFGARPAVAMLLNAAIGAAAGVGVWSLVGRASARPRPALAAGLVVALHPVLVPYTAAMMTEGVTTAPSRGGGARRARALAGVVDALARQSRIVADRHAGPAAVAVLAPVLGWLRRRADGPARSLAARSARGRCRRRVTAAALAVCAPWTARNCARMDRCALVSVNGGWNLAIGTQTESGGWRELEVPEACATVFQEAAKDACFGRAAREAIARAPGRWLARAPAKLRATFDYFGAAPWYLHTANADAFPYRAKVALGAVETLASRLLLAAALVAVLRMRSDEQAPLLRRVRAALAAVGLVACVLVPGTVGYLALAAAICALGRRALARAPLVVPFTAAVIVATAALHAVFFGAGRYGMVVVPFVAALAFVRPAAAPAPDRPEKPA